MSEHIGFDVGIEGAEETINSLNTIQSNLMKVTSLIGTADYAFTGWSRVAEEFNIENFLRAIVATITLMQTLIALTQAATIAQHQLNAAQAMGGLVGGAGLAGPLAIIGLVLSVSLATYGVVKQIQQDNARLAELRHEEAVARAYNREMYEAAKESVDERIREKYRSVVP